MSLCAFSLRRFFTSPRLVLRILCEKVVAGFGEDSLDRLRVHNIGDGGIGNSFLKVLVFYQLGAELVEPTRGVETVWMAAAFMVAFSR